MTEFLGFYNTSSTRTHVRFQFSTHKSEGGNIAPLSAFEAADLRIYRAADGAAFSATQRSSSNGITITSPFDSLTGFHDVDIDLTDNSDSGFYTSGYLYSVVLAPDTETIDYETITAVTLAYFEIGVQPVDVTQLLGTAWSTPATAGLPDVNVKQISTDATAADNAESFFDGTGYAGTNNVIPTVTTVTNRVTANTDQIEGSDATNQIRDSILDDATRFSGAKIDATISSRLASASYTTPPTANQNADALLDRSNGIETSFTLRQALRLVLSGLAGKLSGADTTTVIIRDVNDSKDRITATVDSNGNRTAITTDVS